MLVVAVINNTSTHKVLSVWKSSKSLHNLYNFLLRPYIDLELVHAQGKQLNITKILVTKIVAKREPRGEMRVSLLCAMQPDQCKGYAIIKDYLRSKYNSINSLSLRPSTIPFNIYTHQVINVLAHNYKQTLLS